VVDYTLPAGMQTYDNLLYWANPILADIDSRLGLAATITYVDAAIATEVTNRNTAISTAVAAEASARATADALLLVKANNLSDLASPATARTNLGLSANGSSLVTAANYAAMRVLLGLVIGTDVQGYHVRLADLAGIAFAQGDILYFDGANLVKLSPGTSGYYLKTLGAGANPVWAAVAAGAGTVTSVDITVPSFLAVSGNPVTTNGTFAVTLATQAANKLFAGPATGADAAPTFRLMVAADVPNDLITYAKMQDVSATSRILGRKTAGAGDPEELTLSEVLDFIGSAAQGDVLYRDASGWARLGAGTSGQYLKTNGAGANPAWTTISPSVPGTGFEGSILKPAMSAFTWVNQGTATGTDGTRGIVLVGPTDATTFLRLLVKATPSAPFDVVMRMDDLGSAAAGTSFFLAARNSTNSRIFTMDVQNLDGTSFRIQSGRWTAAGTFSAAGGITNRPLTVKPRWLRFNITSTTITGYISPNGLDWLSVGTETIATFLTATGGGSLNQIGFGCRVDGADFWGLVTSFDTALPT
jgi:hypothetical protein